MARPISFYFDFSSPCAWLALMSAEGIAAEHDVEAFLAPPSAVERRRR